MASFNERLNINLEDLMVIESYGSELKCIILDECRSKFTVSSWMVMMKAIEKAAYTSKYGL